MTTQLRMFLRFLLVGGAGFVIDAGLTYSLIHLSVPAWLARIPAISAAMAFTWLANRAFTYEVTKAHSIAEAFRYAVVAITMAFVNYFIYFILITYGLWPVAAVTVATACQTVLSFYSYRRFVFGHQSPP